MPCAASLLTDRRSALLPLVALHGDQEAPFCKQGCGSERRKRLHDARELGLDAFGKYALEDQILAEPTLQCDPVHITGLLQCRGSLVQVVARPARGCARRSGGHLLF